MARAPLPPDTVMRAVHIAPENAKHLDAVAARMRRTLAEAVNHEIDFLRTFGVTPSRARRIEAEAARRKLQPWELAQHLIREAALQLPPKSGSSKASVDEGDTKRTSVNFTGPNAEFLLKECSERARDFNTVLNAHLALARTYGIHVDLQAALDAAAESGETRRDVVLNILRDASATLPPAPEAQTRGRKK